MATHKYSGGELVQHSRFDTSLLLTLTDIFPDDQELAQKLIQKKPNHPKGATHRYYKVRDSSSLIRKIFRLYIKNVIWNVISGTCKYDFPGNSTASIFMGKMPDKIVKGKRSRGGLGDFDMMATNYTIPRLSYKVSKGSFKKNLEVYVNKVYYKQLVNTANNPKVSGVSFSQRPKNINNFLPYIYDQFPYIKENSLSRIVRYCSRVMAYELKRGQGLRILDKEGEIRFYRPLGAEHHDKVMRIEKKKRITREKNKHERAIS